MLLDGFDCENRISLWEDKAGVVFLRLTSPEIKSELLVLFVF